MAIGNTNSGGSAKAPSTINITRNYEVDYVEGSFPLTFTNQLPGKYDYIMITGSNSTDLNFYENSNSSNGSSYSNYWAAYIKLCKERNEGTIYITAYPVGSSGSTKSRVVPWKFTDNNGDTKYGYRAIMDYSNTSSASLTLSPVGTNIEIYRGYINEAGNIGSKTVKVKFNYSLLLWDTELEKYEIYDASYQSSSTLSPTISSNGYWSYYLQVRIPPKYVLVGITDIDCRYNVIGINDETDGF